MAAPNEHEMAANGADGSHEYLNKDYGNDAALRKIRTAGSISISPELFEKLYLSPEKKANNEFRRIFGNPTPIGIAGFILATTPLSAELLGWRGAGGGGAATVGAYYGCGAFLMALGGLLEFFLGNSFPAIVFLTFGGFWFSFGATLTPGFGAYAAYSPNPTTDPMAGENTPAFSASLGFFLISMAILCFIYLLASMRTNAVFVTIFLTLFLTFVMLAGSHWEMANGNTASAANLQTAGGTFGFVSSLCGWYLFLLQVLAAVDFPVNLPVGDLTRMIKGGTERRKGGDMA